MAHRQKRRRTWRGFNRSAAATVSSAPPSTRIIVRYVSTGVQTDDHLVQAKKKSLNIPQLQSVNRITNFPIVETGLNYAENVYQKIKRSNSLFNWTLVQAETTLYAVVDSAAPAVILLQRPLSQVDKIVCKSLDFVEEKIPSINLPPEMIYWNTKQYAKDAVSTKIVRPVLKRADSVKEIGNAVLASKYTAFAADTLDGALNVADKYVDRYLPAAEDDKSVDEVDGGVSEGPAGKAIHTIHHVDRLGRKLKRRLTKKTLAEVKALKEHSAEAVHVLIYVAELVATDPKLALKKGKELWSSLSQDEPENQARPENLEQLIVLLTRESARRVVHLVNFSTSVINRVNKNLAHSVLTLVTTFLDAADSMVKTAHLERAQQSTSDLIRSKAHSATIMLKNLNIQLTDILDNWAKQLDNKQESEHPKTVLSVPQIKVQQLKAFHTNIIKDRNGIENNSNQTASSS